MKIFFSAFFVLSFMVLENAIADILFLDVNNSPQEIIAARKAATARGEKLIVIPDGTEYNRRMRSITQIGTTTSACTESMSDSECNQIKAERRLEVGMARSALRPLNKKELTRQLAELKKQNVELTSIIISGHDGNGEFGNDFGDLNETEIKDAFAANKPIGDSIQSVGLWGCYTASPGSLVSYWKDTFPRAKLIAGFDGLSPSNLRLGNHTYLEDYLKLEGRLMAAKSAKEVDDIVAQIRNFNQMTSALCVNDFYKVSGRQAKSFRQEVARCDPALLRALDSPVFQCYYEARTGSECQDVPHPKTGTLRKFYDDMQTASKCTNLLARENAYLPPITTVLRLVNYRDVVDNYAANHADQIKEINAELDRVGAPAKLRIKRLEFLTRAELRDRFSQIKQILEQADDDAALSDSADSRNLSRISKMAALHADVIFSVKRECIPFGWVSRDSYAKSPCLE